jgi:enamine deaminase RidA (YjgF/YER057c/UK114 family)
MERFLGANANITTHNSPTPNQAKQTVEGMTGQSEEAETVTRSRLNIQMENPKITVTETPESAMIQAQANEEAVTLILQHVDEFCHKAAKGDARKRSVIESIIILHYLEDYNARRIAEILGERFEEFAGYEECTRKTGSKAGFTARKPKGDYKVWRVLQRFQEFVHGTHLSQAIHKVMVTGTVDPIRRFA